MHGPTYSDPHGCHQTLPQPPVCHHSGLSSHFPHPLILRDSKISACLSSLLTRRRGGGAPWPLPHTHACLCSLLSYCQGATLAFHCEQRWHLGETTVPGPDVLGIFPMGSSVTASVSPQTSGILILTPKVTLWMEGWREPLLWR